MVRKIRPSRRSTLRGRRNLHRTKRMGASAVVERRTQFESLEPRVVLAAGPLISEFQAINVSTLQDEDGDFEDWIEIRNPDTEPVDLGGWYLTDDDKVLTKWKFPAETVIDSGQFLVVFASDKDKTDPTQTLHTNFKLSGGGEYLAIVKPDGVTVSQEFDPYPEQTEDQSYGLAADRDVFSLVGKQAAAKASVPTDDSLGTTWTEAGFDDSTWQSGTTGVGFEELAKGFEQNESFDAPLGADWTVSIPPEGTATVDVTAGTLRIVVPGGQNMAHDSRGTAPIVFRDVPGGAADYEIVTKVSQGSTDRGAAGIVVVNADTGLPAVWFEYTGRASFRLWAGGTRQSIEFNRGLNEYSLRLVRDGVAKTWTAYYRLSDADDWIETGVATDGIDDTPIISNPKIGLFGRTTATRTVTASFDFFNIDVPVQRPVYGSEIGLDVKEAMLNVNPSIYVRIPFTLDGDPSTLDEMALTTRFDDGFIAFLNGTEMASENVPIQSAWDSSASSSFGAVNGVIPTRQFRVGAAISALQQGDNVLAIQAMNVTTDDLDLFLDAQLIAFDVLSETEQFFIVPTPGTSNELPAAPAPIIDGTDGVFFGSTTVTIELAEPNAALGIRYTTDGSVPTRDSNLYTGPLTLTSSAMLQAKAIDSSDNPILAPSNSVSGTFTAVDPALQSVTSDLPLLILDSLGQGLPSSSSSSLVSMNVVMFDTSRVDGRSQMGSNLVDYVGRGGARNRGSSTGDQPKPNMAFETWGKTGTTQDDDEPASLLGMSRDADWVLHAPYSFDRALIRNQMAFQLSNEIGYWASDFRHVEVYLNRGDGVVTQDDYAGVYVLMEKIEQGRDRVDITQIERDDNQEPEITGGYIWKIDRSDPDAGGFTGGGQSIQWVYPKSPLSRTARDDQKATDEQQDWVKEYFDAFGDTLQNPDINDPEGYSKYINPVSWVDQHLLNVFILNVDALRLSAYLYKDREGRLEYGPPWDFDRSAESTDERDDDPFVWRAETGDQGTDFFGNRTQKWWGDLFKDPGFWQLYVDRWQMWRDGPFSDEAFEGVIRNLAADVNESQVRNAARWSASGARTTSGYKKNVLDGTYAGEVNNLVAWMKDRGGFVDRNFAQRADVTINGEALGAAPGARVVVGQEVDLSPPALPFFIDTTFIGGDPGAASTTYFVPGDDTLGDTWTATDFDDSSWQSGPLGIGFAPEGDEFWDLIRTEVNPTATVEGSTTVLSRVEFDVADVVQAQANGLVLNMKYDDGFVAYLNGTKILEERLSAGDLAWNSRARQRSDRASVVFEPFDISKFSDLLIEGTNVLSIRAINSTASNNDLLAQPQLVSREVRFGRNPDAKIYYTTDGTDPRGPDGTPTASAVLLAGGGTITIDESTRIIARNFDDSFRGNESVIVLTDWSGPRQYDLVVSGTPLVVSEINYNPADPTVAELATQGELAEGEEPWDSDDFEFIEIENVSSTATNLVGVKLTDGVEYDFYNASVSSIAAGERVVVVGNPEAFTARYGQNSSVVGQFTGNLNNAGEDVELSMGTGDVVFAVDYGDSNPWPVTADGLGATLELVNSRVDSSQQNKWYSWRSSTEYNGTPGTAGAGPVGVVINEVLAHTDAPVNEEDSIELHNTTGAAIDIGGWFLSDSTDNLFAFEIPAGTIVPAGGYVVFTEKDFNAPNDDESFALGANGDSVYLVQGSKAAGVSQFGDDVHFRATLNGESLGRFPNGEGRLAPLLRNTFGSANVDPRVGPLIISEVQYDPRLSPEIMAAFPTVDVSDLEFIEVNNTTTVEVDLTNWRLRGGADYNFDDGTKLAAGASIIVTKFDPTKQENLNELNAFKLTYGVGNNEQLVGGYAGQLNNRDDLLVLLRPDAPNNGRTPRVQEDEVLYDDLVPWPVNADGTGRSIQRRSATALGNDGGSWYSGPPTPGSIPDSLPGDMDGNGVVDAEDINAMFVQMRSANPDLQFDLNDDGLVNADDRDILVLDQIATTYGDSNFDYVFSSGDFVTVLAAGEFDDGIVGNSIWQTGDWDGDGEFDSRDVVLSLVGGGFANAAAPAAKQVSSRDLIAAALQQPGITTGDADRPSEQVITETSRRHRPIQDALDQTFESLFAEAPSGDDRNAAADDLVDALIDDGLSRSFA